MTSTKKQTKETPWKQDQTVRQTVPKHELGKGVFQDIASMEFD